MADHEPQERKESCSFDPEHLQLPQKHVGGSWMSENTGRGMGELVDSLR